MFIPGFQPLGFQPLGFQAGEWADEGAVVEVVEEDGSNVWQRKKRKAAPVAPQQDFDKYREAARLAIEQLEQDDDALVLLMMAA